jgi:hypothetical protein
LENEIVTSTPSIFGMSFSKMIHNLDPVYPVYHLVKSYMYPPGYRGRTGILPEYIINTWKGFAYPLKEHTPNPEAEKEAEFVKGHLRDIICGGNEADYAYFCKWVAHLFQRPDIKPGVAVFAQSDVQGTGKSLVFEKLIPNMLGVDVTISFSNKDQIAEKFNSWLFTSLYVVFSEQSFYENTENIKSWITEDHQSRRDMGGESRQERSFARFVICTNKYNAFHFDESERRMFVVDVSGKMALADPSVKYPYFDRLGAAVHSAAVLDVLARYFCGIDISDFNPFDIPSSTKKREIIEAEKHPVIDFFEMVAYGEEKDCQILPCAEIDPDSTKNYHLSRALYDGIRAVAVNGEFFIERKKLFDRWRNTLGRNRKESANVFTRIIKKHYQENEVEVLDCPVWEHGKTTRLPVIIIKDKFFNRRG